MLCLQSIGDLNGWIPHGYDVYVIGLQVGTEVEEDGELYGVVVSLVIYRFVVDCVLQQECLVLDELQAAIHKHLGGE